jgi:hypothetical protein
MWTDNEHIFALLRRNPRGQLLLLANFHESEQSVNADLLHHAGLASNIGNLLAEGSPPRIVDGLIYLAPYESMWLCGDEQIETATC